MNVPKILPTALAWISPWVFFPALLIASFSEIKLSRQNLIISLALMFLFGSYSLVSLSYVYLINFSMLIFMLINGDRLLVGELKSSLVTLGFVYIALGSIFAFLIYIDSGHRVGLFGGEANFTGFTLICFFCLALAAEKFRFLCLMLILLNLYLGGSRTLLMMFIMAGSCYYFRYSKGILISATLALFLLIFNGGSVLDYLLETGFLESSGYVDDFSRLLIIADSSTNQRLSISQAWMNGWTSSLQSFFLGLYHYDTYLNMIGYQAHSSFIQKGAQFGAIYVGLFVFFTYKYLPLWVASVVLTYGFFLHNLWSVPVIAFLAYILGGRRNQY